MNSSKFILLSFIVIVLAVVGYSILTLPDNRTPSEKVGDAIHDLDKGPDKAAQQLESRTPGQKIGDAVKDATQPVNHQ
jgi:hypothetical protein